jgi:hypothetical protein
MNNMSELNKFLKVMNKMGYPNPNTKSIARSMEYNLDEFLPDLVDEVGEERAEEFTEKALEKLSEGGKGIKILLQEDGSEYIYLEIYESRIDLYETDTQVLINWGWGESKLLSQDENGDDNYKTLSQIYDDVGMGEWGEWDEMIDSFKDSAYEHIRDNCGFGIWFDYEQ